MARDYRGKTYRNIKLEEITLTTEFPEIMGNHSADTKFRKYLYFIHSACGGLQRPSKYYFLVLDNRLQRCCRKPKVK